jgi:hypothetical protein
MSTANLEIIALIAVTDDADHATDDEVVDGRRFARGLVYGFAFVAPLWVLIVATIAAL